MEQFDLNNLLWRVFIIPLRTHFLLTITINGLLITICGLVIIIKFSFIIQMTLNFWNGPHWVWKLTLRVKISRKQYTLLKMYMALLERGNIKKLYLFICFISALIFFQMLSFTSSTDGSQAVLLLFFFPSVPPRMTC